VVAVSATTRPPRTDEVDGLHYHFLDDAQFDRLVEAGGLLEWATFAGRRYGTLAEPVNADLAAGRTVVLEIDVQGARQIRERVPDALLIFLAPPSLEALADRLRRRGTAGAAAIEDRLEVARGELDAANEFDHVVVNDDVDAAADALLRILERTPAP
jgi:guanylate kinase